MYFCSKYKNWEHMTTSIDIARRIAEVNHPLSRESVHALAEILVCRKYRKGEIVLQAGEVCKSMLFIEKGMLRQFYYKYDKDLTEHIGYENGMIICIESYFKQEPTRLMVKLFQSRTKKSEPHFYYFMRSLSGYYMGGRICIGHFPDYQEKRKHRIPHPCPILPSECTCRQIHTRH